MYFWTLSPEFSHSLFFEVVENTGEELMPLLCSHGSLVLALLSFPQTPSDMQVLRESVTPCVL